MLHELIEDADPAPISMEAAFARIKKVATIRTVLVAFCALGFGLFSQGELASLYLNDHILVTNVLHMEGDLQTPDGKHNFLLTSKALDTWKNVDGKWLQSQSKDLRILVKIDGNVVSDQGS